MLVRSGQACYSRAMEDRITSLFGSVDAAAPPIEPLCLTLKLPPTTNHAYTVVPRARRVVLSKRGRTYKVAASQDITTAAQMSAFVVPPDARLGLVLTLHFPSEAYDLDNHVKLLQDAIQDALGFNDHQIDDLHVKRGAIAQPGSVDIEMRLL